MFYGPCRSIVSMSLKVGYTFRGCDTRMRIAKDMSSNVPEGIRNGEVLQSGQKIGTRDKLKTNGLNKTIVNY